MTAFPVPLRLAAAAAVLSLATDLSMGQPLEHGLRTALVAVRMAQATGLPEEDQITVSLRYLYERWDGQAAAGQPVRPVARPAGLSERESRSWAWWPAGWPPSR